MKKVIISLVVFLNTFQYLQAQQPGLGIYPNTVIANAGGNATVTASAQPTNTSNIAVYTTSSFKGLLQINSATGTLLITNAHPAGTYLVTVKAFNGLSTAVSNFTLTVNNTVCSQGLFSGNGNVAVGALPYSVVIGDFNGDGKQDLVTSNYGYNTVSIRMGNGSGFFSGNINIPVGTSPQALAIGDFNGDGKQDIAVANLASFNISILLGNGAGNFSLPLNVGLAPGSLPYSLAVGDFNSDGKQDLVTANYGSNNVSVLSGDGLGGFMNAANVNVGNGPRSVVIGDFNNDGKQDLATANYLSNSVSIRLGNGSGAFSGTGNSMVGSNPHSITIGDFNNDGKQDLATANISNSSVSIRIGDGAGNFGGTTEVNVGIDPRSVAIGDFNGDGKQDLATVNYSTNTVSVRLGNGAGIFTGNTSVAVENSPFALAIGDFNGDGKEDLAVANAGSADVSIRLGIMNEINVQGNNIDIADGDNTAAAADHTDFGNVTNNLTRYFSIQNTSPVNLTINSIVLSGADASLFTAGNISFPVTIAGGGSYTFPLTFIPTSIGIKTATVNIINDHCDKGNYDFSVQGTGVAMVSTLGTYPASNISAAAGNITVMPDASPTNVQNITAYTSADFKGLLQADPLTGAVTITNAYPAGVYNITVKANGVSVATSSFTLTVNNTACSQGLFIGAASQPAVPAAKSVAIGDFNRDGIQDMAIANNNTGISIRMGTASVSFNGTNEITVGSNPRSTVIGDFNADGKQDIACLSGSNDIAIRLGNGLGDFYGTGNMFAGLNPLSLAIGDFNGDGKQDLATANYGNNSVSILLGDGLANFSAVAPIPVGNGPYSLLVADFNSDGKQDLATANYNSNNISIRLGDGLGGFTMATDVPVGVNPNSIVAGDFNADGKQDLATTNYNSNNISIRIADGAGNFIVVPDINAGVNPGPLAVGDFNGDGKQDLAAVNYSGNNILIRFGSGTGGFPGLNNVAVGSGPLSIAIGDFNADGKQDLVTANAGSADISIRMGSNNEINVQGNNISIADADNIPSMDDHTDFGNVSSSLIRTFTIQNTSAVNLQVKQINIAGIDSSMFTIGNIGLPVSIAGGGAITFTVTFVPTSAAVKTATVKILNDNCSKAVYDFAVQGTGVIMLPSLGAYPVTSTVTAGGNITVMPDALPNNAQNITAYTSTDFKGLLQVDITTGIVSITNAHPAGNYNIIVKAYGISAATRSFMLTVNNTSCSQGLFSGAANVPVGTNPFSLAMGDFNGDGKQDIATANNSANTVSVRLGDGIGNFNGTTNIAVGNQPYSIAIGDFNGDGKQDIATANHNSNTVSIRLGNGLGNFSGNTEVPVGNLPTIVVIGDFNGDGKQDLSVANLGSNTVSIRLGDGAGNFSGTMFIPLGSALFSLAIGDFNGDGKQDIATANYNISTVSIYLGDGLGGFNMTGDITVGINPYSVVVGDFNADGKQDLATANYNNNNVSVCLGNGTGQFSLSTAVAVGIGPGSLAIGDFNGDGKQDLATANYLSNSVSIRLGDGAGGFTGTMNMTVGSGPESIVIGDFNADGKQDLAIANNNNNTVSIRLGIASEINIQGNNMNIADGNTTPTAADHTDFGIANNITRTFNIQNTGNADLTVGSINMTGANASLFTVSGISLPIIIPATGSAAFMINFIPVSAGVKTATVNISNNDCNEALYDFAVQGTFDCQPVIVSFTGMATSYCINASAAILTGSHMQGSVFTGAGILDNGNGTAIFDPGIAGTGLHTINYVYTDVFGCTHSVSQPVTVNALPVVSFSGLATSYFINDAPPTLTGNQAPNGIFTGPGITNNGNGTAVFDPAIAGPGMHIIIYSYSDINGCSSSFTQQVLVTNAITLNLRLYLQGYYTGNGTMQPVLNNQAVAFSLATETDTITVELHDPATMALIDSKQAVLLTDGLVSVIFTQPEGVYYIAIRHRNSVQTWSADPLLCTNTAPLYDFTLAAGKAFADNQVEVDPGVWAFFTGDINQDEFVDGNDFPEYDIDSFNGVNSDYKTTDINGDGFVDGNDFPLYDLNSYSGVSSIHP